MYSRHITAIEKIVSEVLVKAGEDYHRGRGRFIPFACNRIHEALRDYARKTYNKRFYGHVGHRNNGIRSKQKLDSASFKRGLMMA